MTQSEWEALQSLVSKLTLPETKDLLEQLQGMLRASESLVRATDQANGWSRVLKELDALPIEGPQDKFSGADHDQLLYGRQA